MGFFPFFSKRKEGKISQFVNEQFSALDRTYRNTNTAPLEPKHIPKDAATNASDKAILSDSHEIPSKHVQRDHDGTTTLKTLHDPTSTVHHHHNTDNDFIDSIETKRLTAAIERYMTSYHSKPKSKKNKEKNKPEKTQEEMDEEEAYATLTYLALLTCLYLPLLLFLWIRRSVFGATSLIRSLFLGHVLRLSLAFMLLPPSATQSFLPSWLWKFGCRIKNKIRKCWYSNLVQRNIPTWVHTVVTLMFIDAMDADPRDGSGGGGNSSSSSSKDTWPPPALVGLAAFTLLAFVVHPDGLTWMIFGQLRYVPGTCTNNII